MTSLPPILIHASRNAEITRAGLKVLIRLHETLNSSEFRPVRSWHVASLLGVDVSSVNRSLQHLEALGYVERGERCGNSNYTYRLSVPTNGNGSPSPLSSAA